MTTSEGTRRGQARQPGRDVEIWRAYCGGATQEAIARRLNVNQATVSRAIDRVRKSIPDEDKAELVQREIAFLNAMRDEMMADFAAPPPPAFDQKGNALEDPETGEYVRDPSARYAAYDRALRSHERLCRLLGLDAPAKVDVDGKQEVRFVIEIESYDMGQLR